jgi:hypothetical protein
MSTPVFILSDAVKAASLSALERGHAHRGARHFEWTDICHGQHGKTFVFVTHEPSRSPSRWTYADNKRPFIVYLTSGCSIAWSKQGSSSTLNGALEIAKRAASEWDSYQASRQRTA